MRANFLETYGPWALVTGASNGIGQEIAIYLAELGFKLALVARSEDKLQSLASDLGAKHGIQTLLLPYDLTHPQAITEITQKTQHLDIGLLVAAAGFGSAGPLLTSELRSQTDMLKINCEVPLEMSYLFADRFVKQKRGGIILFGSIMGFQGAPNSANYAATKGYIQGLGEGLHIELKPHGVDVLISAPGPVRTGFAEVADMQMRLAANPRTVAQATVNALGKTMTVRPGFIAKFMGWSLMMAPRRIRVSLMKIIMDGMMKRS